MHPPTQNRTKLNDDESQLTPLCRFDPEEFSSYQVILVND